MEFVHCYKFSQFYFIIIDSYFTMQQIICFYIISMNSYFINPNIYTKCVESIGESIRLRKPIRRVDHLILIEILQLIDLNSHSHQT